MYQFIGTITEISNISKVGSNKNIDKLTFVCRSLDEVIAFTLLGKDIVLLHTFKLYDKVTVKFKIVSNCYGESWYTNCNPVQILIAFSKEEKDKQKKQKNEDNRRRHEKIKEEIKQHKQQQQRTDSEDREYEEQKKQRRERRTEENGYKSPLQPEYINYFEGCSSQEQIRNKFRILCKKYYPTLGTEPNEAIMIEINLQHDKIKK